MFVQSSSDSTGKITLRAEPFFGTDSSIVLHKFVDTRLRHRERVVNSFECNTLRRLGRVWCFCLRAEASKVLRALKVDGSLEVRPVHAWTTVFGCEKNNASSHDQISNSFSFSFFKL